MLLVIDAGNTNTVFAVFEGDEILGRWRFATDARRTSDEYAVWILNLFSMQGIRADMITAAIISTVVPRVLFDLKTMCRNYFKTEPMVVGESNIELGIPVNVERPSEVGSDRLVNALAAQKLFGNSLIILDFGTATTFDVVDNKGAYAGGVIAPGINLSLEALHMKAAKLPNIAVSRPKQVIGKSTVSAMQSGIFYGYLGLIDGITGRIKKEFGKSMKVVATGGLAPLFSKESELIDYIEPDLTMIGLKQVYDNNKNVSTKLRRAKLDVQAV